MDLGTLQRIALDAADLRPSSEVLTNLVQRLAAEPEVALARVWLARPGDICSVCPMRSECSSRDRCLHLVASAGRDRDGGTHDRIDGRFRRFPLKTRKIGRIGCTGEAEHL